MSKIITKKNLLESKTPKMLYKKKGDLFYKQNSTGGKWVKITEKEYNNQMGLDELVNEKGGKLHGDEHVDQSGTAASSKDTTDDHVRKTRQGVPMFRRYYSEGKDKTLDEVAKDKMKKVVEDILTKKKYDKDVIDKVKHSGNIPDISMLKDDHPVLVRKISHIKTLLDRDEVGGDEKAILLNALLSSNMSEIPNQYKRELARKLGY